MVAWISWLLVILNVDPVAAAWWGFALFYVTLFLAIFGSLSLAAFAVRALFSSRVSRARGWFAVSLRQAFLWTSALIIALLLQAERLLTWWMLGLVIIVFILIESFIVGMQTKRQ